MRRTVLVRSIPDKNPLGSQDKFFLKILEGIAHRACAEDDDFQSCAVAWDTWEEVYRAYMRKEERLRGDVLEKFCEDHPDDVQCKMYDV